MYEKVIKLSAEGGRLRGFFLEKIKVAIPETLCKTIIGFSPEYPCDLPNVAMVSETRNDDGCFTEAPVSAKQAGVLHRLPLAIATGGGNLGANSKVLL